jgi:hypothetical protein
MQFCALSGGLETIYFKIPKTLSTSQWLGFLKHYTNEKCPDCTLKFVQDGESVYLKGRGLDILYHWN